MTNNKSFKNTSEFYIRAWQKASSKKRDKKAEQNPYSKQLVNIFDSAFKRITGSRNDRNFMHEVFAYPVEACDYATRRIERLSEELTKNSDQKMLDKTLLYRDARENFIIEYVENLIQKANATKVNQNSTGIDRLQFWIGEKGCGKTTFLNFIFHNYNSKFNREKLIWLRHSFYFRDYPTTFQEKKKSFFIDIRNKLLEHYTEIANLNSYPVRVEIWKNRLERISGIDILNKDLVLKKLDDWETDAEKHAEYLMRYLYKNQWGFIIVLDNVDQHEKEKITKSIVEFAVKLTKRPVRSLVLLVSRSETVLNNIQYFRDIFPNIDRPNLHVPTPEFNDVFQKRLKYIERNNTETTTVKSYDISGKTITISKGTLASYLAKYFLTQDPSETGKYLIASLANNNMRSIFGMIKSILISHISDLTDIPIQKLILNPKEVKFETHEETIRRHLIIWSLALKDNHLFYKDDIDRTYIQNIYDVTDQKHSYFLKRLIIDFLSYMKDKKDFHIISEEQLNNFFNLQLNFSKREVKGALEELCDMNRTSQLVIKERHKNNFFYSLSSKGYCYSKFVCDLYIYLEMIIEDTLLPETDDEYGVPVELIEYEPLLLRDSRRRKIETISFLRKKHKQVIKFLSFLERREIFEKKKHNNFEIKPVGFTRNFFPELKKKINDQSFHIGNSLGISL